MNNIAQLLTRGQADILQAWMAQMTASTRRADLIRDREFQEQCTTFLRLLSDALSTGTDVSGPSFQPMRDFLTDVSRTRAGQGFTPSEVALFVLSIKRPVFDRLRSEMKAEEAGAAIVSFNDVIDSLALNTTEAYQRGREEVIQRQQQEMMELSTPVVKLWDGVLALPLIGTLDSARTQIVMESLLQKIVDTGSMVAIIDITGVPTVDTLVAQHLLKTVTAARLMGADCIISGIRPQIAQTIVHLGVTLDVVTKANLADAFLMALQRMGVTITRNAQ